MRLAERVALVTGIGGPMGFAVAQRFAAEGASVIVTDISGRRLDAAVATIVAAGANPQKIVSRRTDATVREELAELVDEGTEKFDHIDIIINIVGGRKGVQPRAPMHEMEEQRWDDTFALNLKANFHLAHLVAPGMLRREYGKIVNVSSINFAGEPGNSDYGAAKAAVASITRTMSMELAPHINVNCIVPGIIKTSALAIIGPEITESYRARTLLGRLGEPEDIANAALFLASDEASYITGINLPVSGGIFPAL